MAFWKNEYAVADIEDGDEIAWYDDCEDAVEYARKLAAERDGSGYRIIAIRRCVDERTECEAYIGNGDGTVSVHDA